MHRPHPTFTDRSLPFLSYATLKTTSNQFLYHIYECLNPPLAAPAAAPSDGRHPRKAKIWTIVGATVAGIVGVILIVIVAKYALSKYRRRDEGYQSIAE
jgi:heme/copper-type cytochrome/quinol oxidase subunit 2